MQATAVATITIECVIHTRHPKAGLHLINILVTGRSCFNNAVSLFVSYRQWWRVYRGTQLLEYMVTI